MLDASGRETVDSLANSIHRGLVPEVIESPVVSHRGESLLLPSEEDERINPFDQWALGSIAVIPLSGLMMKESYWWGYGMDDTARLIRLAYASGHISAVVLKANTPGGAVDSLYLLEEVLSEKLKPTYGYIDGHCASCGYIALSYTDKIYSISRMASVGSIGVYARLLAPGKDYSWYKVIEVYPEESKDKNLPVREALEGKPGLLKAELSTLAVHYQETAMANRPGIDRSALTGKLYYAFEGQEMGLIDGIKPLGEVIPEIERLINTRQQFLQTI